MQVEMVRQSAFVLFLRRCVAYALDCLLIFLVTVVLLQGVVWLVTQGAWWNNLHTWLSVEGWIVLSVVLPAWLYFALFEASPWQATFGKRLLGVHVSDVGGKGIRLPQALLRTLLKLIPWNFVHIALLVPSSAGVIPLGQVPPSMSWWWGFLVIADTLTLLYLVTPLFTGGQRSIHDLLAGTCVTRDAAISTKTSLPG